MSGIGARNGRCILTATKPILQRAPKGKYKSETYVKPDGIDYCLDCWKEWMHGDCDRDLKAKPSSGLRGNTDGYGNDIWEAQAARDNAIGSATNTEINNMAPQYIWAIYRMCSLATSWQFKQLDFMEVGIKAKEQLTTNLKRNVCTSALF
jgi:hypothetical protein